MKTLTKKSEITARELKANNCIYLNNNIGFIKKDNLYFIGSVWTSQIYSYHESLEELKSNFYR